jgi:hypothetical protein
LKNKLGLFSFALPVLVLLLACTACVRETISFHLEQGQRVGIAGFYQPASTSELLAGYVPEGASPVDSIILAQMDNDFAQILRASTDRKYVGIEKSYQCAKDTRSVRTDSAFDFWLTVGKCMDVDVIIVPQLQAWQERDGGELGAMRPAAVVMDFFLLDVKKQLLLARSRFDETQQALSANLLDIGKYITRGGKWISAEELAKEGITRAVRELGL